MSSSTFNFERIVPVRRWHLLAGLAGLLLLPAIVGWEIRCRLAGYAPTVNDSSELWARTRGSVAPDSLVIIGDSRAWFDLHLATLAEGLGRRPLQLALKGSCAYPVLEDLARDESFRGMVLCSVVPAMFFAPAGPPMQHSLEAVAHYHRQTLSERMDLPLAMFLERRFAFMNMQELTLGEMLKGISLPDRAGVPHPPRLPPYFNAMDSDRQARMIERCVAPGPLQDRVRNGWIPLFTPPPPPRGVTPEQAQEQFRQAFGQRLQATVAAVERIRARGGKVVFLRLPCSGALKELEDRITPRERTWDVLLAATRAPGIHFEDHPELDAFICPEWSHLAPADAAEFTRRLLPYLRQQLQPVAGGAAR